MADVTGFRGLRFRPETTGPLDNVITPPYDVISPEERTELAARGRYNYVHVILPEAADGESPYGAAAARIEGWIAEGALKQDETPGYYLLRQTFKDLEGTVRQRRGFFAATRLPEPGEKIILGHERTFDKPVEDRLNLTRATRANLGAVFVLYDDPAGVLAPFLGQMDRRPPDYSALTIDGTTQEFWCVAEDPRVASFFQDKRLYIADGHHRFRTACLYRDEMRALEKPPEPRSYDRVLMGFVAFEDPGLRIFPPHRIVRTVPDFRPESFIAELEEWFSIIKVPKHLLERVNSDPGRCVMGLAIRGKGEYLLRLNDIDRTALLGDEHGPAWRDLDVGVLHGGILERLLHLPADTQFAYEKNAPAALAQVAQGQADLAFILRPTRPEQIQACAEAGEAMPQKSTYFFPKLPSGGVVYRLD